MVANCDVMLDTFPWGAGVTAMEALSAGVPVVTLPARVAVLPLALGQVSSSSKFLCLFVPTNTRFPSQQTRVYVWLPGSMHCSCFVCRCSAQVTELGVENELVASDVDDMVNKAVKLASDEAYRKKLSSAILDKKDRLSDPHRATREWEQFLERAVRSAVYLDTRL